MLVPHYTEMNKIPTLGLQGALGVCACVHMCVCMCVSVSAFCFLATSRGMWNFPDRGSNLCALQWKRKFLTIGPPRKFLCVCI